MALSGAGQTVLYDFYADWCGPCRAMGPTVEALIAKGYPIERINVDQNRPLAQKFRVEGLPCFVMVVDGREVDRVIGGTTFYRLERMCQMAKPQARDSSPALLAQIPAPGANNLGPNPTAASRPGPNMTPSFAAQASAAPAWQGQPGAPSWQHPASPPVVPVSYQHERAEVAEAKLVAASVRLRVEDPNGHSCGSGTIIDTRNGKALILTCGHIFRDSAGKGKIEVDLFGPNGPQRVPGELLSYDSETRDVGLVTIGVASPVVATRVAPPGYLIRRGQPVISVGCNHGDQPTARHSQISALDKYVYTGPANAAEPANIEVADQPVEGRSGGGLFSADGYVLGVCNAADPGDKEGLYASLGPIYTELDRANLSYLYKTPGEVPNAAILAAVPAAMSASAVTSPAAASALAATSPPAPLAAMGIQAGTETGAGTGAGLAPYEQAAWNDIKHKAKQGATIVCIVNNPDGQSEVYVIDNASAGLRKQVSTAARAPSTPYPTSYEVPRSRRTILEWSADSNTAESNRAWKADGAR
jgi:thiol-disulfide isomerase/thioredoxin